MARGGYVNEVQVLSSDQWARALRWAIVRTTDTNGPRTLEIVRCHVSTTTFRNAPRA